MATTIPRTGESDDDAATRLVWQTGNPGWAQRRGSDFKQIDFRSLRANEIARARSQGMTRATLANPFADITGWYESGKMYAITNVTLDSVQALRDLYGCIVEPCYRAGSRLLICSDRGLDELKPEDYVESEFGYPFTLERLHFLIRKFRDSADHHYGWISNRGDDCVDGLDPHQSKAVLAGHGVVQIIAPAGSGKTRTLLARVTEMVSRGIPQKRILCTSFNSKTSGELKQKLAAAGLRDVDVHTFHSLGRRVLKSEGRLRPGDPMRLTFAQWNRLGTMARNDERGGVWLEPAEASVVVESLKMSRLTPAAALKRAGDEIEATAAVIFELYERQLRDENRNDFHDYLINSVELLGSETEVRERWQHKWECVLVDEYQDIEPLQELLVQILAAPHDSITAVGDEDQCIYTWRRASVARSMLLDQAYPGLVRHPLETSYRCPKRVLDAARALISHNKERFPKTMQPARSNDLGVVVLGARGSEEMMFSSVAAACKNTKSDDVAVLSRTKRLLRSLAIEMYHKGIPFRSDKQLLVPSSSEKTLLCYLRLLAHPADATAGDVKHVFSVPARRLPKGAEEVLAERLRDGRSFMSAVASLGLAEADCRRMNETADCLDRLAGITTASEAIRMLRTVGGLDTFYAREEKLGVIDMDEIDTLGQLETQAQGSGDSVQQFAEVLKERAHYLNEGGSDSGAWLSTVHGAKGCEWGTVYVLGCSDDTMPHKRSVEGLSGSEYDSALEEERRLAYVAFTRSSGVLKIEYSGEPSRFLYEACILKQPAPEVAVTSTQPKIASPGPIEQRPSASQASRRQQASVAPQSRSNPAPTSSKPTWKPSPPKNTGRYCSVCKRPIRVGEATKNIFTAYGSSVAHQRCPY